MPRLTRIPRLRPIPGPIPPRNFATAGTSISAKPRFPMLVARRDPPFESGAHTPLHPHMHMHLPRQSSRFVSALQIVGTLVGIPVGLATIYSVYHSSFTVEARCETLRAN